MSGDEILIRERLSDEERRIVQAWRENRCDVTCCATERLNAVLLVIRGHKTHMQYAQLVLDAADQQTKRS